MLLYYIILYYITLCIPIVYIGWCHYMCDYENNEGNE